MGADWFVAWHRWNGVPRHIGEVKDLPLNLSRAFLRALQDVWLSTGSRRRQSRDMSSSGRPGISCSPPLASNSFLCSLQARSWSDLRLLQPL
ncbi:hypothetical protein FRX31_035283 [Thalictrum thalictroides]|uniref:Uncharacterized protein n=1 Tax=Thalictrum thalictroides TaxID=46969 RepID=A0A7J6URC7_THATH|nr:hypothetical protein FRX31_035283 [Thalictrum thalictroides]